MATGWRSMCFLCIWLCAACCAQHIKHVILLQLENRAFDHMVGWLPGVNGLVNQSNPMDPTNATSPRVYVNDKAAYVDPDPGHSLRDTAQQVFGTVKSAGSETMNGFVANALNMTGSWGPQIMSCFSPTSVPVVSTLAQEFAIIDNFFSAVPAETYPNRVFTLSATSYGYVANDDARTVEGWPQPPIFAALDAVNVPWTVYFDEVSTAWLFQYTRSDKQLQNFHVMKQFYVDAAAGNLSSFVYIDPGYFDFFSHNASDQHPSHDVVDGELLIKGVYEALRASPVWNDTVLIVAWDEHGGFYDHVPPPSSGVPAPDNQTCVDCPFAFGFDRLGVRTPALIVSPWVQKGQVISNPPAQFKPTTSSQMELSSIPATLHHVFGTRDFLTARDAWAVPLQWVWNTTYSHITAPRTDCPLILPSPPAQSPAFEGRLRDGNNAMSSLQRSLLLLGQAVARVANSTTQAIDNLRKHGLDTEAEGGYFLKKIITRRLNWTPTDAERYTPNTGPSALERYLDVVTRHKAFVARAKRQSTLADEVEDGAVAPQKNHS